MLTLTFSLYRFQFIALLLSLLLFPQYNWAAHAFSLYDSPKYPAHFTHFDYVNPNAKKTGEIFLANPDRRSSFDKFNPFSLKGVAAAGVAELMFETLAVGSLDETATMYGLLAKDIELAKDRTFITFTLHANARFNNGDPVLAKDVKHSFDTLIQKGNPQFKSLFADIKECIILNNRTVRFNFKTKNHELPLIAGGIPVFSHKWGGNTPFDKIQLDPPIASGPYLIEKYDVGRTIHFQRNPNYWGKNLPVRIGMFNFEKVHYRFYKDDIARLEAFKKGEFDITVEYSAKNWARSYTGRAFANNKIIKRTLPHANGAGMQGFVINLRRSVFADIRVRQALGLALDYEWMNQQLFYNQYTRTYSFFNNSEMAATGLPSLDELKLLEPLRAQLNPAVFGPAPVPPKTTPPYSLRHNLILAKNLLQEAGWAYRNGALRNKEGTPFTFEILDDQSASSRILSVYIRNLEKLGIKVKQRGTDFALLQQRMDEFDFDMTTIRFPDITSPGNEMLDMFSSRAAQQKGSSNLFGIADPAVDNLIQQLITAQTRKQLTTHARALDRVLLHNYMIIPHWFSTTHRVAYHNRFGIPNKLPLYYQAAPWMMQYWWEEQKK
jgi:microcin C transport system substrate-binding protein